MKRYFSSFFCLFFVIFIHFLSFLFIFSQIFRHFFVIFFNKGGWTAWIYAPVIGKKLLYVSCDNECKKLFCVDGVLKTEFEPELYGSHKEGDTRVMFHAMHVDRNNPGSISVRGNDTGILIILLTSSHLLESSRLWFDTGFDSTNTRN